MGLSHASIIGAHHYKEELHVCDTNKLVQSGLKKYSSGTVFHNDYKKMLASTNLDAVLVATPTSLHFPIVSECIAKNIPVFCEKPFCLSPTKSAELATKSEELGTVTQVGYHNNFLGTFTEMKRLLNQNIIGDLFHFTGESNGPVVLRKKKKTWRTSSKEGGGCLSDYAAHVVNLLQVTLGKVQSVKGSILKKLWSEDVEDAVYSNLFLENGLSGSISVNWSDETFRKMSTSITVQGTLGKIICDATELKIYLNKSNSHEGLEQGWNIKYLTELTPPVWFNLRGEEYSSQIDHFLKNAKNSTQNSVNSFREAAETNETLSKIRNDSETIL